MPPAERDAIAESRRSQKVRGDGTRTIDGRSVSALFPGERVEPMQPQPPPAPGADPVRFSTELADENVASAFGVPRALWHRVLGGHFHHYGTAVDKDPATDIWNRNVKCIIRALQEMLSDAYIQTYKLEFAAKIAAGRRYTPGPAAKERVRERKRKLRNRLRLAYEERALRLALSEEEKAQAKILETLRTHASTRGGGEASERLPIERSKKSQGEFMAKLAAQLRGARELFPTHKQLGVWLDDVFGQEATIPDIEAIMSTIDDMTPEPLRPDERSGPLPEEMRDRIDGISARFSFPSAVSFAAMAYAHNLGLLAPGAMKRVFHREFGIPNSDILDAPSNAAAAAAAAAPAAAAAVAAAAAAAAPAGSGGGYTSSTAPVRDMRYIQNITKGPPKVRGDGTPMVPRGIAPSRKSSTTRRAPPPESKRGRRRKTAAMASIAEDDGHDDDDDDDDDEDEEVGGGAVGRRNCGVKRKAPHPDLPLPRYTTRSQLAAEAKKTKKARVCSVKVEAP
jgi:hypothetical protein